MPNWLYIVTHTFYLLGAAVWIGGGVILGALVAPALFRSLPRPQAGGIFGPILRRFARMRLAAVVVMIVTAAIKHFVWETHAISPWIAIRWAALAIMAAIVLYELFGLEPAMKDVASPRFPRLHKRAESLMKAGLASAVVALLLS
ncbi:MAG TPA: DUF4149 domain-containing protein [Thermoanaerobaculia bacterium]|nr:DUF4149 domain-containing protein [Thermoanaerobaculia bacterium]